MTQEDKELLLKDLCARLPYNCRVFYEYVDDLDGKTYGYSLTLNTWCINEFVANKAVIKPYLRPMSSMTKDEKEELVDFGLAYWDSGKYIDEDGNAIIYGGKEFQLLPDTETYDWFNKNHFDYRGLIGKGLAIDCSNLDIY